MSLYNNFIGMDIGKRNFVVTVNDQKETKEYNNTMQEIKEFSKDYKNILGYSLCIKKNTGSLWTRNIVYALWSKHCCTYRADASKVKNLIRSHGNSAKTDKLDAKALANIGLSVKAC